MVSEQYIYQAMSIHLREKDMLGNKDLERLAAAKDIAEAYAILNEKGWNTAGLTVVDAGSIIAAQQDKTWELVKSLVDDLTPLNVFLYANDYHNLKAAVKLAYSPESGADTSRYFIEGGTVDIDVIEKAAQSHDFSLLPPGMADAGKAAYEALAHTGNGQNCDMIIDNAALAAIDQAGKGAQSELLKEYARLTVDSANIKAAVRCANMKKKREFIERAIVAAGSLAADELIKAAQEGINALYDYLLHTAYSGAVDELKKSMAAFERWCDNQMMALIRPQRYNFFSIEPIAAYILAREIEIRMVKLIFSAKINDLSMDVMLERLRESYV